MPKVFRLLMFGCLSIILFALPGNFFQWDHPSWQLYIPSITPQLSIEEQAWLKTHQPIRIAFDGDNPPYSFIDESGQLTGIAYDTLQLISKKIDIEFEISSKTQWKKIYKAALSRKVDIVATMVDRPERQFHFAFTQPYIFKSLVLVTHQSNEQIKTPADLSGKIVAFIRNYQYTRGVIKSLKNIKPLYVNSIEDALLAVEAKRADATISFYSTSSYLQNKHLLRNIKFVNFYNLNSANESIAVRKDWPILHKILQKALNGITHEEKQSINKLKHVPVFSNTVQEPPNKTAIIILLVALTFFLWLALIKRQDGRHKLKRSHQALIDANTRLYETNENLSQQIQLDTEQSQANELKFKSLAENLHNEFFFYQHDSEGGFSYLSPSVSNVLGYSVEEFSQHYRTFLTDHPDNLNIDVNTRRCLKGEKVPAYLVEILDNKGNKHILEIQLSPFFNHHGECAGLSGIAHDITHVKKTKEELNLLTYYDTLTGLANNRLFSDRVEHILNLSHRQHKPLALLRMNLDGFKLVNDSFGHDTGDEALIEIANRLTHLLRSSDTAARTGGDEFALILFGSDAPAAKTVTQKILKTILKPFNINNHQFNLGCSIGISIYPRDGSDCKTLLSKADSAMLSAKNNDKRYSFCSSQLNEQKLRQQELEQSLRIALTENNDASSLDLNLVYQSKHWVSNNNVQGYEAFIRWQHPKLGAISPSEFILLAEQTGLIADLSRWVITQAGLQAVQWTKEGVVFEKIALNISEIEIINFNLANSIMKQIDATGALHEWIEIELTESTVMKMPDVSCKLIEQLNNAGVLVTIDHYKGLSSSPFLKNTPINYIKIAPALISNILDSLKDRAIVQDLIDCAHQLDKKVIAVGIESEEQLQLLKELDCDIVQGQFFSRPSSPDQVALFVSEIFN